MDIVLLLQKKSAQWREFKVYKEREGKKEIKRGRKEEKKGKKGRKKEKNKENKRRREEKGSKKVVKKFS